jgi:hypothetical protein
MKTPEEREAFNKLLKEVFEGVKVCFCFTCSHQPSYGPCAVCGCKNLPYAERLKEKNNESPR